jgi:arylamine N-acetyltransferase
MPQHSKATSIFLELYKLSPMLPDLKLLGGIAGSFAGLPWENLSKFIKKHRPGQTSSADLPPWLRSIAGVEKLRFGDEVLEDHARLGTGGTCFSLTNALRRIVTDLGFRTHPVMADMQHGPNVHCALLVEVDGSRYLLDPGYLVAEPIPLDGGQAVRIDQTGSELEYRRLAGGDEFALYTRNERGEHIFRYRLRSRPVPETEFARFWIESFDATGMNGLHLNRVTGEGRLSAHDLNLRIDTGRAKRNVKLRDAYVEQVSNRFGLDSELVRQAYQEWEKQRCRRR